MKKYLKILIILFFLSESAQALEAGKWLLIKEDEYCYIGSTPIETDLPKDKKRGDTYTLVYKMIGTNETVVQIGAGYNYNLDKDIVVKIDNSIFSFYTVEDVPDSAWTDDDTKVIYAMKQGLELIITGESSRGTITNDKYTLSGFTAAYNKLTNDCK